MSLNGTIDITTLAYFALLVLPRFISMRVYSLIRSGDQPTLRDSIFEALAYGMINLGLMWWAVPLFVDANSLLLKSMYAAMVLTIAPIVWPFALDRALSAAAKSGLINYRYKTAWDDFFSRRKACWIIVHLNDGRRIGGVFAQNSYATLYPNPGHIFIEELWQVNQDTGAFEGAEPVSQGIILKPSDYRFLEIRAYKD